MVLICGQYNTLTLEFKINIAIRVPLHMLFYVYQSHSHDSTHCGIFTSWGALWHGSFLACFGTVPWGTHNSHHG